MSMSGIKRRKKRGVKYADQLQKEQIHRRVHCALVITSEEIQLQNQLLQKYSRDCMLNTDSHALYAVELLLF